MPSFLHPALFWTLGLPTLGVVALPVLIHLINMMRHRRLEWAAMEFLLVSQKKHRTWVILKQLLLLLLRMAGRRGGGADGGAAAAAQPLHQTCWAARARITSCCWTTASRCRTAGPTPTPSRRRRRSSIASARNAVKQDRLQSFTLLRFSRAGRPQRRTEPDLIKEPVSSDVRRAISGGSAARSSEFEVTQLAPGPVPALQAIAKLLGGDDGRASHPLPDLRLPRAAMERSDRHPQGAAATQRRRRGDPPDRLRRSRPSEPGDRLAGAGRGASARRACRC